MVEKRSYMLAKHCAANRLGISVLEAEIFTVKVKHVVLFRLQKTLIGPMGEIFEKQLVLKGL